MLVTSFDLLFLLLYCQVRSSVRPSVRMRPAVSSCFSSLLLFCPYVSPVHVVRSCAVVPHH